tara:strand:- start:190 stop:501 length:312 start_codon:yes stop_codon:yes gene_type:complete
MGATRATPVSNLYRRGLKVLAAAPPRRGTIGAEAKMPDWLKTSFLFKRSIVVAARKPVSHLRKETKALEEPLAVLGKLTEHAGREPARGSGKARCLTLFQPPI